ncbi:glycosyltransferase family 4 protein [Mariniflexile aquimaris]|uniref:Glycosyltransferase family 4 protein n=1 Tax=Mariniflexile aquimaris TaxID=881009 RepID=A0ABW3BW36_9FLAO
MPTNQTKKKLIRVSTVPLSLSGLLTGQLKFMSDYFEVIGVSSNRTNQLDIVHKQEGIRTIPVDMYRQISPIKDLMAIWELYKVFKREKPFIVHSITPKAGLLSMVAAKFAGVPHRLHTFTGLIFPYKTGVLQKILIFTDKILCACATNIYPEGKGVENDLKAYHITSKPLNVIGNGNVNGIDLDFYSTQHYNEDFKRVLKKDLQINTDDYVFVFVGRLVRDKGINELVSVFNKLNEEVKNIKLLLVGDYEATLDPLDADTLQSISDNKNIITTGWVDDVRPYFAISNCLTFPSYREGFPNVVLQAGAMGLPCIVTDISGCNEIIIEGQNGIIIPVKDKSLLYEHMLSIYQKKIQFNPVTCRELIASRYEQSLLWRAVLNEYNRLN